ncbi:MAG: thiamine diphosphokinase [Solibacillus sp.]
MITVICSGGPASELIDFSDYVACSAVFIGADRGAYHLLERGIVPKHIVGDFDSVTEEEWQFVKSRVQRIERVQAEKDETDTDLALYKALELAPTEIVLTGVTGGRLDHYEAALRSMKRLQINYPHISFKMCNAQNELRYLTPGQHSLVKDTRYPYVSFFAQHTTVRDVTLRGVKYETTTEQIDIESSRFTSNEIITSSAYIEFRTGICLMIRSVD